MAKRNIESDKLQSRVVGWGEIASYVRKINPEFADIVDGLDLKEELEFCKIDYPYGAPIFDRGRLFVPSENGGLVPFDSMSKSSKYEKFFDGVDSPLGFVLNKGVFMSIEEKNQFIPLCVFYPGMFFGLWELFDNTHTVFNKNQWNLYSGARALFSTTRISNLKKYQAVKRKFDLRSKLPKNIKDHYFLFSELANHQKFSSDWKSTVLFFSKKTQEKLMTENILLPLRAYFFKYVWQQSMPLRFDAMMGLMWNKASDFLKNNNFKNFGLQLSILKHIFKVILGTTPCFISHDKEEVSAPLSLIKEILIDEYKVDFCPTIMVPGHISKKRHHCGYYSVNESIPVDEAYVNKSKKTTIETMRNIYEAYDLIKSDVLVNDDYIDNKMLKILTEQVKLDFFHSMFDQKDMLKMSSLLPEEDLSLVQLPEKYGKSTLPFNDNGSFYRGLIRINSSDFYL